MTNPTNTPQLWQQRVDSVFSADRFDLLDWGNAQKALPSLTDHNEIAANEIGGQPVQDGFFSLYKADPQFGDQPSPLKTLVQKGMETPQWQNLKTHTTGQLVGAGMGGAAFWSEIIANLPEDVKEAAQQQAEKQEQADNAQEQADNMQALADLLADMPDKAEDFVEAQAQANNLKEEADQLADEAAQALTGFEDALSQQEAQVTNILNQAAGAAAGEAKDANAFVKGFCEAAGGDPAHVNAEMAQAAMQVLKDNPNLKALAEFLGWAKQMSRGEWRDAPKGSRYMTGYKSHELQPAKMATSERLAMISQNHAIRADFMRRVVESSVSHVSYEGGEEQAGKGPLVVIDDQSGSMQGRPHSLTKALIWSLLEIARRDNREFYNISFSGLGQFKTWQAPAPGNPDPAGLIEHMSHFYNGGTEPYQPINVALDLIEAQELEADILIVTDEAFGYPQQAFVDRCRAAKVNIVTVTIGRGSSRTAELFSDYAINVGDLVADKDQLRKVIRKLV